MKIRVKLPKIRKPVQRKPNARHKTVKDYDRRKGKKHLRDILKENI